MESLINSQRAKYLKRTNLSVTASTDFIFIDPRLLPLLLIVATIRSSYTVNPKSMFLTFQKPSTEFGMPLCLKKLPYYGILHKLCKWITGYISDRRLSMIINCRSSSFDLVKSGVQQG